MSPEHESSQPLLSIEVAFADELRRLREAQGWRLEDLAERLRREGLKNMNKTALSRMENLARPVRMSEAIVIASVFGVSVMEMLEPDTNAGYLADGERDIAILREQFDFFEQFAEGLQDRLEKGKQQLNLIRELYTPDVVAGLSPGATRRWEIVVSELEYLTERRPSIPAELMEGRENG